MTTQPKKNVKRRKAKSIKVRLEVLQARRMSGERGLASSIPVRTILAVKNEDFSDFKEKLEEKAKEGREDWSIIDFVVGALENPDVVRSEDKTPKLDAMGNPQMAPLKPKELTIRSGILEKIYAELDKEVDEEVDSIMVELSVREAKSLADEMIKRCSYFSAAGIHLAKTLEFFENLRLKVKQVKLDSEKEKLENGEEPEEDEKEGESED